MSPLLQFDYKQKRATLVIDIIGWSSKASLLQKQDIFSSCTVKIQRQIKSTKYKV